MAVETKREPFVVNPRTVRWELLKGQLEIVAMGTNGVDKYQFLCDAAELDTVNTFQSKAVFEAARAGLSGPGALRTEAEGALERYFGYRRLDPHNDRIVLGVLVAKSGLEEQGFIFDPRGIGVWGRIKQ